MLVLCYAAPFECFCTRINAVSDVQKSTDASPRMLATCDKLLTRLCMSLLPLAWLFPI